MRDLFIKFRKEESGASLVEYAVALIVVTIVGGAGVILLGQASGQLATNADTVVSSACTAGATAPGGVNASC
ncbi:MAG: Flp family type IVb pilin [Silicimonas sp.]|nr:Flp family type IVb pilin [Silicimonas sp.]